MNTLIDHIESDRSLELSVVFKSYYTELHDVKRAVSKWRTSLIDLIDESTEASSASSVNYWESIFWTSDDIDKYLDQVSSKPNKEFILHRDAQRQQRQSVRTKPSLRILANFDIFATLFYL